MTGGFSLGLTVVCIVFSFLAGMAVNESSHQRRRMIENNELADYLRRWRKYLEQRRS